MHASFLLRAVLVGGFFLHNFYFRAFFLLFSRISSVLFPLSYVKFCVPDTWACEEITNCDITPPYLDITSQDLLALEIMRERKKLSDKKGS